jgi:hypothetical protein
MINVATGLLGLPSKKVFAGVTSRLVAVPAGISSRAMKMVVVE